MNDEINKTEKQNNIKLDNSNTKKEYVSFSSTDGDKTIETIGYFDDSLSEEREKTRKFFEEFNKSLKK